MISNQYEIAPLTRPNDNIFADYTCEQQKRNILGIGGYGYVYTDKEAKYAWKHVCANDFVWLRDILITQSLDHPNIIKYDDISHVNDYFYTKFTHVDGQQQATPSLTMRPQMKLRMKKYDQTLAIRRLWTDNDINKIIVELLDAINYCHNRKILHRDIKEENILIKLQDQKFTDAACSERTAKSHNYIKDIILCDFGLAKYNFVVDDFPSRSIATISHRPPEIQKAIIQNKKILYDERVDAWGLCILFTNIICKTTFFKFVHNNKQTILKDNPELDKIKVMNDEDTTFSKLLMQPELFYRYFDIFLKSKLRTDLKYINSYLAIIKKGICSLDKRNTVKQLYTYALTILPNSFLVQRNKKYSCESIQIPSPLPSPRHEINPELWYTDLSFTLAQQFILREIWNYHSLLNNPIMVFQSFVKRFKLFVNNEYFSGTTEILYTTVVLYIIMEYILLDHPTTLSNHRKYWSRLMQEFSYEKIITKGVEIAKKSNYNLLIM